MKLLLKCATAALVCIDSLIASVARPWAHRLRVLDHSNLTSGTTPRYRPPTGRPRRRR